MARRRRGAPRPAALAAGLLQRPCLAAPAGAARGLGISATAGLLLRPGLAAPAGAARAPCPAADAGLRSRSGGQKSELKITSFVGSDVAVFWVDDRGNESPTDVVIGPAEEKAIYTFVGHAFRIRADDGAKLLVADVQVTRTEARVGVAACGVLPRAQGCADDAAWTDREHGSGTSDCAEVALHPFLCTDFGEYSAEARSACPVACGLCTQADRWDARKSELEGLVHDWLAPCDPPGKSGLWSCVRKIAREDYSRRLKDPGPGYGFADKEEAGWREVGAQWDYSDTGHVKQVPRVANTSGFLKMSFTGKLRDILMPFWKTYGIGGPNDSVMPHGTIPGGFTNSHAVGMTKLDLDSFRSIQRQVHLELKAYLEWWTDRPLTHTSTFGIRIYHRGSMLIDHVDHADTHIASAVIQIDQDVDEDGGWPLEVIDEEGDCFEVYLQPGELVLYEGGRFRHGRPMRLRGNYFANVFSHFSPPDWKGPGKSPKFDGHLDERGWLLPAAGEARRRPEL